MTSYNQEAFVEPAIKSVLAQTFAGWELVVVDDGSRDRSHEIATEFALRDLRIRALRKDNGGHCSAINHGLGICSAETDCLFFLDGDDLLKPRHLELTTTYLDAHPEVGVVCCQADQADGTGQIVGRFHRSRWVPGRFGWPRDLSANEPRTPFVAFFCATGQGMSGLYRRSVFARTAGWDTQLTRHEDTDMLCQMSLVAEVHYLPEILYTYRIHGQNITRLSDATAVRTFATFKPGGYDTFRKKWDNWVPRTEEERRIVSASRRHYYGVHRPLRFLKIAGLAVGDFFRTGRWAALRWAARCTWEGFAGAGGFWLFGWIR